MWPGGRGAGALVALSVGALACLASPPFCHGNWALVFLVFPDCPACQQVLPWVEQAASAFWEVNFLVVLPWEFSPLTLEESSSNLYLEVDEAGRLAGAFSIARAPTAVFLSSGRLFSRLEWPFSEREFIAQLEAAGQLGEFTPQPLVGGPAPTFSARALAGREVNLEELGRPLLLVFFNLGCPACWEVLPALEPLTSQVAVAVLISLGGPEEEQVRLAGYAAGGGVHVLEVGPGVVETYRLLRTPTFFLVDGEGVIVWAKEGFSSEAELVVEIRGILAGLASQGEHPEN